MNFCSIMTGNGFENAGGFLGAFSMAWLGMVILFFLIALTKKWIGEEMGIPFSALYAYTTGFLAYIIVVSITCGFKWALLVGIIGFILGGFGTGAFGLGDGGDY